MRIFFQGIGPDRLLMMVSTEEEHHFANSGTTLPVTALTRTCSSPAG